MRITTARTGFLLLCFLSLLLLNGCRPGTDTDSRKAGESRKEIEAGVKLLEKGREKPALDAFDRALASAPSEFDACRAVVAILMDAGMYEQSTPYIKRAIAVPPPGRSRSDLVRDRFRDSEMYRALGDAHYQLNKVGEAERAYRQAVRLNRHNSTAYNNWGYMYADLGIKLDAALRLTKRAVELEPRSACFIDSLGWAYYRKGQTGKALELLKKAAWLYPSDPEVRQHLGKAYEAQGDMNSALIEYHKAAILSQDRRTALQPLQSEDRKPREKK
ncbi:MAG TPA: tetratricopeptide repeat protein [Armatimonadota bacterium]|nr:tetratricopeptide repeat protein [Armatimonadota bacterium]